MENQIPNCKLKVCAECNQIRGYNKCKKDILELIDEIEEGCGALTVLRKKITEENKSKEAGE